MLRCETLFLKVIPTMTARSQGEPLPKMYSDKLASLMALALNRQKKYKKKNAIQQILQQLAAERKWNVTLSG